MTSPRALSDAAPPNALAALEPLLTDTQKAYCWAYAYFQRTERIPSIQQIQNQGYSRGTAQRARACCARFVQKI